LVWLPTRESDDHCFVGIDNDTTYGGRFFNMLNLGVHYRYIGIGFVFGILFAQHGTLNRNLFELFFIESVVDRYRGNNMTG
jgi:hypothetical protein